MALSASSPNVWANCDKRKVGGVVFQRDANVAIAADFFRHVTQFEILGQVVAFISGGSRGKDRGVRGARTKPASAALVSKLVAPKA